MMYVKKLRKDTKVGVDCGYSDGENIKFAEEDSIDLYVPSRAQAQEFDGKEQSLKIAFVTFIIIHTSEKTTERKIIVEPVIGNILIMLRLNLT